MRWSSGVNGDISEMFRRSFFLIHENKGGGCGQKLHTFANENLSVFATKHYLSAVSFMRVLIDYPNGLPESRGCQGTSRDFVHKKHGLCPAFNTGIENSVQRSFLGHVGEYRFSKFVGVYFSSHLSLRQFRLKTDSRGRF